MKSFTISFLFILAGLLGFLSQAIYATIFGTSNEMDLYFALLSVPSIVTGISSTIFNAVIIPLLASQPIDKKDGYIAIIQKVTIKLSIVITIVILILMLIYAYRLTRGTNLLSKSIFLCAFLALNTYLTIINGFKSAVLNFERLFFTVSATPLLVYICNIISVLTIGGSLGVTAITIGMCIAAFSQFVIYKHSKKEIFKLKENTIINLDIKLLIKRITLIIVSLLPFTTFSSIAYLWATYTYNGGVSYLGYSHSFSGFVSVAASMGIATITFPDIAISIKSQNNIEIRKTMRQFENTILFVSLLNLSICIFVTFNIKECVGVLLKRGSFGFDDVVGLSLVLPYYFFGGAFISILNLTRNVFYSSDLYLPQALLSTSSIILFTIAFAFFTDRVNYVTIGIIENSLLLLLLISSLLLLNIKYKIFGIRFVKKIAVYIFTLIIAEYGAKYICGFINCGLILFNLIIEFTIYFILDSIFFLYLIKDDNIVNISHKVSNKCQYH